MDPSITVDERKGRWVYMVEQDFHGKGLINLQFCHFYCNEKLQNSIILFGNMTKKKLDDETNMP